jgi:hypothetical protein
MALTEEQQDAALVAALDNVSDPQGTAAARAAHVGGGLVVSDLPGEVPGEVPGEAPAPGAGDFVARDFDRWFQKILFGLGVAAGATGLPSLAVPEQMQPEAKKAFRTIFDAGVKRKLAMFSQEAEDAAAWTDAAFFVVGWGDVILRDVKAKAKAAGAKKPDPAGVTIDATSTPSGDSTTMAAGSVSQ